MCIRDSCGVLWRAPSSRAADKRCCATAPVVPPHLPCRFSLIVPDALLFRQLSSLENRLGYVPARGLRAQRLHALLFEQLDPQQQMVAPAALLTTAENFTESCLLRGTLTDLIGRMTVCCYLTLFGLSGAPPMLELLLRQVRISECSGCLLYTS